jgi:GNAT superfamily N-acetyltransferase
VDSLRRARTGDEHQIAAVFAASRRDALPYLRQVHDPDGYPDWVAGLIATSETWVAEEDGRIVAMMVLGAASLDHLYVAPGHQGRGLGTRLLELAREQRPAGIGLWAFQRNGPARDFYERRGFVPVEFTPGDNEEGEPDVRYEWRPS